MQDASVEAVGYTLITNATVAVKSRGGAKQPEIMEGLYHRYSGFAALRVNRRRNLRKSIMDVNDVRSFPPEKRGNLTLGVPGPGHLPDQEQPVKSRIGIDFVIGAPVCHDTVSEAGKKLVLKPKNDVFTARLLILVMYEKNFHPSSSQGLLRCRRCPAAR
jgi:hypothetical protein